MSVKHSPAQQYLFAWLFGLAGLLAWFAGWVGFMSGVVTWLLLFALACAMCLVDSTDFGCLACLELIYCCLGFVMRATTTWLLLVCVWSLFWLSFGCCLGVCCNLVSCCRVFSKVQPQGHRQPSFGDHPVVFAQRFEACLWVKLLWVALVDCVCFVLLFGVDLPWVVGWLPG